MTEQNQLKRLNFFTGFFTTAQDWEAEQTYHRQKLEFHNRWFHTPGIIRAIAEELRVEAIGGLKIQVRPGAALDDIGREIYLPQPRQLDIGQALNLSQGDSDRPVYITIEYYEEKAEYVENVTQPHYSGHTRVVERPLLTATLNEPDNKTRLELARILLQAGATEIGNPQDPDHPQVNEINRNHHAAWAGAVGIVEAQLPPEMLQQLIQAMRRTRRDFAALDEHFPVPSAGDVRHTALTGELLARTGGLRPERWLPLLVVLAATEQDVGRELNKKYGNVVNTTAEFLAYEAAVEDLQAALRARQESGILTKQDAVAQAAWDLAEIFVRSPIADAGRDQNVTTAETEVTVTLDGSKSRGRGGREIVRYHWRIEG